jgi:NAD(P)-dependent dehydrogenase (short-subunit alcohol dehydrogenase family)
MMRFDLSGQRALITGASSGLGLQFAGTLARSGAAVVLAARRLERLEAAAAELRSEGHAVTLLALDVCDAASVNRAFDTLSADCGGIDILVNNAGVTVSQPAITQTEAQWNQVLDTNLKGAWLMATEAARRWKADQRPGVIVNIASILGERVAGAVATYCASKAGLIHLTKALALEWARHSIRVNALAPGYIATELNSDFLASEAGQRLRQRIAQRRFGDPADLDGALLLLASEAGRYITGSVITVDGGHLLSSL